MVIDAGVAIREELPDAQNQRRIQIPSETLHAILLTHPHTDHVGDLPHVINTQPNTPVFAPERNRSVMAIMIREAFARQSEREPLGEIESWYKKTVSLIDEMEKLEDEIS